MYLRKKYFLVYSTVCVPLKTKEATYKDKVIIYLFNNRDNRFVVHQVVTQTS